MFNSKARDRGILHRFGQVFRDLRAHRTMMELQSLDDHTLADIGLSRSAIAYLARNGRKFGPR